ncbi:putative outer membrane protein OmpA [hydrothermal vent metagenome]|uniref:Putative outer membrane protein OmpA n=1 Tax=hydrothermal vent metagenome TaxID=652676 RepID=A0A1W1C4A9_9ZZZZ
MKKILIPIILSIGWSSSLYAHKDVAVDPITINESEDGIRDDYIYVGIAFVYHRTYSTDHGWFDNSAKTQDETGGLTGLIGYNYNNYLAIEGRVSKSLFKEDYADISNYAIFAKPQYKFIDEERDNCEDGYTTIYALIGYGVTKVEGTDGKTPGYRGESITDDSGFQWGLGISYTFDDENEDDEKHTRDGDITIFAEYNSFMKDREIYARLYQYDPKYYNKLSQDAITLGLHYRF